MPANVVRTPREARLWAQAKAQAAAEGHAEDWPYVMGTFERMRTRVGGANGRDVYRRRLRRDPQTGRLVLRRSEGLRGVRGQDADDAEPAEARQWYTDNPTVLAAVLRDTETFPHVTVTADAVAALRHYPLPTAAAGTASVPVRWRYADQNDRRLGEVLNGAPALRGSPKQAAWADTLREQALKAVAAALPPEAAHPALRRLGLIADARWWIDHRDLLGQIRQHWGHEAGRQALDRLVTDAEPVQKSRRGVRARDPQGRFIRPLGRAHRVWRPNPKRLVLRRRLDPMPVPAGRTLAHPMAESSLQVMAALTTSKRRMRAEDWHFRPEANLPGHTARRQPVGKPGIFLYKSDPAIRQALAAYRDLLRQGKAPSSAIRLVATRWPWALEYDTPKGRDWWAAVRRAGLPVPPAFDLEIDPDANSRPRPRRAVFWREDVANLGQGIIAPTGSGGAGR